MGVMQQPLVKVILENEKVILQLDEEKKERAKKAIENIAKFVDSETRLKLLRVLDRIEKNSSAENRRKRVAKLKVTKITPRAALFFETLSKLNGEWTACIDLFNMYRKECENRSIAPLNFRTCHYYLDYLEVSGVVESKKVGRSRLGVHRLVRVKEKGDIQELACPTGGVLNGQA